MLPEQDIALLRALQSGAMVDLQITTPTAPKRARTHYIGMDIPNAMMFAVPQSAKWAALRDLLLPDNTMVVRYVLEGDNGTVIAFKVKMLRLMHTPLSMVITSFPQLVQSQGLRTEKRGQLGISVEAMIDDEQQLPAIIVDMSSKGCRLAIAEKHQSTPFELNKALTLRYKLEGESVNIISKVKNHTSDKVYRYYGLQFEQTQSAVTAMLERYSLFYE